MYSPTTIIALKLLCEVVAFERIMSRGSTTIARLRYTIVVLSVLILNTSELRRSRFRNTEKIEVNLNLNELDALRMTRFELVCSMSTLD